MAPKLELHDLRGEKRAADLAILVERLYRERRRLVVWVRDAERRKILDDWMWTRDKLSFVPHCAWTPEMGDVAEPVVLLGEPANPNGASVLVVGDELPPDRWAMTFDEVHDLIPPGEAGEQRRAWWEKVEAAAD